MIESIVCFPNNDMKFKPKLDESLQVNLICIRFVSDGRDRQTMDLVIPEHVSGICDRGVCVRLMWVCVCWVYWIECSRFIVCSFHSVTERLPNANNSVHTRSRSFPKRPKILKEHTADRYSVTSLTLHHNNFDATTTNNNLCDDTKESHSFEWQPIRKHSNQNKTMA